MISRITGWTLVAVMVACIVVVAAVVSRPGRAFRYLDTFMPGIFVDVVSPNDVKMSIVRDSIDPQYVFTFDVNVDSIQVRERLNPEWTRRVDGDTKLPFGPKVDPAINHFRDSVASYSVHEKKVSQGFAYVLLEDGAKGGCLVVVLTI